jgi:hypothetical protein
MENERTAAGLLREYNAADYYKGKPAVVNERIKPFLESIGFPRTGYQSPTGYGSGSGSDHWRTCGGLSKVERIAVIAGYPVEITSQTRFRWVATYSQGYWGHRVLNEDVAAPAYVAKTSTIRPGVPRRSQPACKPPRLTR